MLATNKAISVSFALVGMFVVICLTVGFLSLETISDLFMGNKITSLNCDQLPNAKQVEIVIKQQSHLIEQIKNIRPGSILVEAFGLAACPEKGFLLIIFGGYNDRVKIKSLIGSDTFLGIPY